MCQCASPPPALLFTWNAASQLSVPAPIASAKRVRQAVRCPGRHKSAKKCPRDWPDATAAALADAYASSMRSLMVVLPLPRLPKKTYVVSGVVWGGQA
jgi:hypothetical protein